MGMRERLLERNQTRLNIFNIMRRLCIINSDDWMKVASRAKSMDISIRSKIFRDEPGWEAKLKLQREIAALGARHERY